VEIREIIPPKDVQDAMKTDVGRAYPPRRCDGIDRTREAAINSAKARNKPPF